MIKHASMFSQLLSIFNRQEFSIFVEKRGSNRNIKGFSNWTHFVSMLFCQMASAKSLREISDGLKCCLGKLTHLGIQAPSKSSLSYANRHRPWELYQDLFYSTLSKVKSIAPGKKFKFRNKLLSLDGSIIDLSLKIFPWSDYNRTKGAVKLHLLLDHDGYLPRFVCITEGKVNELEVARELQLPPDSVIAIDRGYLDFELFSKWTKENVWFVTKRKSSVKYKVLYSNPLDLLPENILADDLIKFTGKKAKKKYVIPARRVLARDPETDEEIELITNNFEFEPTVIAAIYRERWQIEIFFKTLKQNLKIKTFVGTSLNAIRIQIWTALIAILLIKYLQFSARWNWSLSNLVALFRWNIMSYRSLWDWINNPFNTPPDNSKEPLVPLPFPDLDSIMEYNQKKDKLKMT